MVENRLKHLISEIANKKGFEVSQIEVGKKTTFTFLPQLIQKSNRHTWLK